MKNTLLYSPIFLLLLLVISNSIIAQKVAAGRFHSLVICEDSTIWSFGRNQNNQGYLGLGHFNEMTIPAQIPTLSGIIAVSSSVFSLALKNDGTVWMWGPGFSAHHPNHTPMQVQALTEIAKIDAGGSHLMGLRSDSTVWTWGYNSKGQVGHSNNFPFPVTQLSGIIDIAAGREHSLALKSDGTVWGWGKNLNGQLGNGTDSNDIDSPVIVNGLTDVIAISAGGEHSLALKNDGTVWSWGLNSSGQLGDGSSSKRLTPVQVSGGLNNVKAISAGDAYSIALRNDGTAMSWGFNGYGQLGNGNEIGRTTPILVNAFTNGMEINAGDEHNIAIKNDGNFWAWGNNLFRRLGDGTTTSRNEPVKVQNVCVDPGTNLLSLNTENAFKLYPNPASTQLHIFNSSQSSVVTPVFVLYDMHGREMSKLTLERYQNTLERENLNSGVYFYQIHSGQQVVKTGKVVFD
jgi:alpha-tubulin suppressor-like RCC1 family protein